MEVTELIVPGAGHDWHAVQAVWRPGLDWFGERTGFGRDGEIVEGVPTSGGVAMSEESRKHNSHAAESWRELAGDVRQWADGHRLAITATVALVVLNSGGVAGGRDGRIRVPAAARHQHGRIDFGKLFCTAVLARGVIQPFLMPCCGSSCCQSPSRGLAAHVPSAPRSPAALGGVIVGLILRAAAGWLFQDSQFVPACSSPLSPLVLPVGALMAASAGVLQPSVAAAYSADRLRGDLWSRCFYSGNPGDYCILAAAR